MARDIEAVIPGRPRGTLRFWGDWFGRPMDNLHTLVACRAEGDRLILVFDDDESLTVWSPHGFSHEDAALQIADASRVRWEWCLYGSPKTRENVRSIEYARDGDRIAKTTDWPSGGEPSAREPAVRLVG